MNIMKFGGTSVGSSRNIKSVVEIIKSRLNNKPIVVVSAISQATNILHCSGLLAASGDEENYVKAEAIIAELGLRHTIIAKELLGNTELFSETIKKKEVYFAEINSLLKGIYLLSELSPQSYARLVAYGELLSSTIVSSAMIQSGIKTALIDARDFMITDDNYYQGRADMELIQQKMPGLLAPYLNDGTTVITQGFIAKNKNGITTTFGREGSDYSAALIGNVMNANEIEIWTDVDGIMTADPKSIKGVKFIPEISFTEAAELTAFGAKVLHPATIKPAVEKNIPVRILNTMNLQNVGSLIKMDWDNNPDGVKSIAAKERVKVIKITANDGELQSDFVKRVFEVADKNQLECDLATVSLRNIDLIIEGIGEQFDKFISELKHFAHVTVEDDKSLVSLVGKGLHKNKALAKNILDVLDNKNVVSIIQNVSQFSISLIIDRRDLHEAVQILHEEIICK